MTNREAEETLSVIRTLMERSTRYTCLSGHAGIAAGMFTLLGGALRWWGHTPLLPTWFGVLVAACAANIWFTMRLAKASGEPFWTRQTRTVVLALTPALIAGLVLTAVLARLGLEPLLPGVWMLLWGVGALAMSFFTPQVLSLLGVAFMVAGTSTLLLAPIHDVMSMVMTFGAMHLIYGTVLFIARRPLGGRASILSEKWLTSRPSND
jgi:hypothetical protein